MNLLEKISLLEPYGEGNSEPTFVVQDVLLLKTIRTKNGHIICKFTGKGGGYLDAVFFRGENTPTGDVLLANQPNQHYHVAGQLRLDTWNGQNKVQLIVSDVALA